MSVDTTKLANLLQLAGLPRDPTKIIGASVLITYHEAHDYSPRGKHLWTTITGIGVRFGSPDEYQDVRFTLAGSQLFDGTKIEFLGFSCFGIGEPQWFFQVQKTVGDNPPKISTVKILDNLS